MHPLLYEVNARHWLFELSVQLGRDIDLASVPDEAIDGLEHIGVTHLWLMGVWPTGPRARREALTHPALRRAYDDALPGWDEEDVLGSPYAVAAYRPAPLFGGDAGLAVLREQLRERGIKLVLDFVPNHLGVDHPWVRERPELFVRSREQIADAFEQRGPDGAWWIAHGKDPYFPGWTDTAQLDYRRADTRAAMIDALRSVASRCDGVRCDMAMLLLDDVFARTWAHAPAPADAPRAHGELWSEAIATVRTEHPHFLFLAEVYWDLEHRLCELGFDYAYDKRLYDALAHDRPLDVLPHVLGLGRENARRAHFLENHDEPRAPVAIPADLHRAAALLTLGLPGMRFLHDGQLEGRRTFARIQLSRRLVEASDVDVARAYANLLADVGESAVGRGEGRVLTPQPAWPDSEAWRSFVLVQWRVPDRPDRFDLVVVNLAAQRAQCTVPLEAPGLGGHRWTLVDRLGPERWTRDGDELAQRGLYLDVAPRAAQLFAFRRE